MANEVDTGNELLNALKERFNSPFFGTYIIFTILINFDSVLILLFSKVLIEQRIQDISKNLDYWFDIFIYPIALTILYLAAYPWITNAANWWRSLSNHRMARLTLDLQKAVASTKAESDAFDEQAQALAAIKDIQQRTSEVKAEIDQRKKELNELETQRDDLQKQTNVLSTYNPIEDSKSVIETAQKKKIEVSRELPEGFANLSIRERIEMLTRYDDFDDARSSEEDRNFWLLQVQLFNELGDVPKAIDALELAVSEYVNKSRAFAPTDLSEDGQQLLFPLLAGGAIPNVEYVTYSEGTRQFFWFDLDPDERRRHYAPDPDSTAETLRFRCSRRESGDYVVRGILLANRDSNEIRV